MASYGHIEEFEPGKDDIETYLERVDLYFSANAIADDRKVALFLTVMGPKSYNVLSNLLAPEKPKSKTFEELSTKLKEHYQPKRVVIAERFHFHQRVQKHGENMTEFLAQLRQLATHCKFGNYLNEALRDRFVCGLRDEAIQRKLLSETDLTLSRALELARGLEVASKQAKELKDTRTSEVPIHALTTSKQQQFSRNTRSSQKTQISANRLKCNRCGGIRHTAQVCRFREAICHACHKKGHLAKMCRSKQNRMQNIELQDEVEQEEEVPSILPVHHMGKNGTDRPIMVEVKIAGRIVPMEVDTGSVVSIISEKTYKKRFSDMPLTKSSISLSTYTKEKIAVLGKLTEQVEYEKQKKRLSVVVIKGEGPSLLGRDWLMQLKLNWKSLAVNMVKQQTQLESLLDQYSEVFKQTLGTITSYKAKLHLKEGAKPKFNKARPVPFALRQAVENELGRLEKDGIIESIDFSEWAAPVVAVPKPDGHMRLCGDYRVSVNSELEVDQYPLPRPEELFTTLTGGKQFTKLDLKQAYQQMELEEESQMLVVINTHKGLYRFKRVPYGIAPAPALFQRFMDTILRDIPQVICYIDDILITGHSEEEHFAHLEEVLKRLKGNGVRVKKEKCDFLKESVEYLGHKITANGIQPTESKVEAVVNAPRPTNKTELKSFLGMLQYYGKFIPQLSTLLYPLNRLLRQEVKWEWSKECENVFKMAKQRLTKAPVLTHYDPSLPIRLAGDASAYGIGAVISHVFNDGSEHPIAYASRTLTRAEKNYAQIEREALSLIFGLKKFHNFLYGRDFILYTDHKPLTTIFGAHHTVSPLAASRLQRWALHLSAYRYVIQYKNTTQHANVDGLSRLPLKTGNAEDRSESSIFTIRQLEALPITIPILSKATRQDPILSRVIEFVNKGWPKEQARESMRPFWNKRNELVVEEDCLMWGIRTVIPNKLRSVVLKELHSSHLGIVRMKMLSRSYFWWPKIDKDIESVVNSCSQCQVVQADPPVAPLHPWTWPKHPWERLHIDFAGPFMNKSFLVLVDAHSKWPEVVEMNTTTTEATIRVLRRLFSSYGLPKQIISDNGPQFTSVEFQTFMKENGIKHIRSSPYHPASNGQVERFIQTFKRSLKASCNSGLSFTQGMYSFLLMYRVTPHCTTSQPPCKLFLGRQCRTRFDLLTPDVSDKVNNRQEEQKKYFDTHSKSRGFTIGQTVWVRNYIHPPKWKQGRIVEKLGPVTYKVAVGELTWKRHVDQLRNSSNDKIVNDDEDTDWYESNVTNSEDSSTRVNLEPQVQGNDAVTTTDLEIPANSRRYPSRIRRPPDRYF